MIGLENGRWWDLCHFANRRDIWRGSGGLENTIDLRRCHQIDGGRSRHRLLRFVKRGDDGLVRVCHSADGRLLRGEDRCGGKDSNQSWWGNGSHCDCSWYWVDSLGRYVDTRTGRWVLSHIDTVSGIRRDCTDRQATRAWCWNWIWRRIARGRTAGLRLWSEAWTSWTESGRCRGTILGENGEVCSSVNGCSKCLAECGSRSGKASEGSEAIICVAIKGGSCWCWRSSGQGYGTLLIYGDCLKCGCVICLYGSGIDTQGCRRTGLRVSTSVGLALEFLSYHRRRGGRKIFMILNPRSACNLEFRLKLKTNKQNENSSYISVSVAVVWSVSV